MSKKILLNSANAMMIGLGVALTGLSYSNAAEINVKVTCDPPSPGTYWLGWGTSRLEVDQNGRVYIRFRGIVEEPEGVACRSGDNSGLIHFGPDGKVWAYLPVTN